MLKARTERQVRVIVTPTSTGWRAVDADAPGRSGEGATEQQAIAALFDAVERVA